MDNLGQLNVEITGDASGLTGALQQAQSSLASFGQIASGVFAGVGLEQLASGFVSKITEIGRSALDSSIQFEQYTTSLGTLLSNVGKMGDTVASDFSAAGGRVSLTAMQLQDEMISYSEKMQQLQDDLAETTKGENVVRAEEALNQRLDDLAASHADKIKGYLDDIDQAYQDVADRQASRQQSMQDTLSDLEASHDNQVADKKEKFEEELSKTKSQVVKDALTKQFNEELSLDQDSFQRRYDLRKQQLERDNAQAEAADKAAADKKITSLQSNIDTENSLYNQQTDRIKAQADQQIADYEVANAKKLISLKQELADEERAHVEHLARLKLEATNAGAAIAAAIVKPLADGDPFKAVRRSVQDEMAWLSQFTLKTPFQFKDLVQTDNLLTAFGLNAQQLLPVIGDIGASFHKNIGDSTQAVLDALEGRWQMLKMNFGITKEDLSSLGAQIDKSGQLLDQGSFFRALVKLRDLKFAGGMQNQMDTLGGTISNLQDKWFFFTQSLMSGDAKGKIDKNSVFALIKDAAKGLGDFLDAHGPAIAGFLHNLSDLIGGTVRGAIKTLGPDVVKLDK